MGSDPTLPPRLSLSSDFIPAESTPIMGLLRAIESSRLLDSSQIASAIPLPATNGVGVVDARQSLGSTVLVTTRFGTLLLLCRFGLGASIVELLRSFIITYMDEQGDDTICEVMTVDEAETTRLVELEDQERLLYALREIASTSNDAESVRVALVTLATTESGAKHLKENPITL